VTQFTHETLAGIKGAFDGEDGKSLIDFMRYLSLGQSPDMHSETLRRQAKELGWLDEAGQRTRQGTFVSDSCREYLFWVERDRKLPWATALPDLGADYFTGRDVVEIGSGMGANLLALSETSSTVGIEPTEAYVQLGTLFAEREQKDANRVLVGTAEHLPLEDDSADAVLCVTAHQYFDLAPAMTEISRVLRPGGEAFFFGPTLSDILKQEIRHMKGPRSVAKTGIILANTLSYTAFQKRIIPARAGWATGRPVYPSASTMWRFMKRVGIAPVRQKFAVGEDSCLRGKKAE